MPSPTIPIRPATSRTQAFEYLTTKKDELVGWARKFSLFPYPFVTACCAMEFMAVSSSPYDTDRFGAALPRFGGYPQRAKARRMSIAAATSGVSPPASVSGPNVCREVRRSSRKRGP